MQCPRCAGKEFTKAGRDRQQRQVYRCCACGRRITTRSTSAFRGYRFPDAIIALVVRWSLRYRLSYADVAAWLAERGITVDPGTIYDWGHTFTPRFIAAARAHRAPVGQRWRVDETYFTIAGRRRYLFRAIDAHGQIIDVYLSDRRNAAAARTFFEHALAASSVTPTRVTTNKATCYPPALHAVFPQVQHRFSKYLNNGLERDHQHLKGRVRPMRRFKRDARASTVCCGHALIRNLAQRYTRLTADGAPHVRLATAWTRLAATI